MGLDTKSLTGRFLKNCEIQFKRFVFLLYRLGGGIKKAKGEFDPAKTKKVLFIRHDKLGDMVISLPIFHNLKRAYPHLQIDLVCGKDNYEIVRTDPNISKVYYYHKKPLHDINNVKLMRAENYDCVIDLIFGASVTATILVSLIAGDKFKLGVGKLKYAKYFDKTIEWARRKYHIIESTGRVLNLFGLDLKDCDMTPKLFLEESDYKVGREFVAGLRNKYNTIVGINLSAGRPARTWPMVKYKKMIGTLLEKYPKFMIALTYAPSDYYKAEELLKQYNERLLAIPQGMNIRQVTGLLSQLDFLITPDTSLTHLASAVNLPSVVMFSGDDGNFNEWGPYNPRIRAVRSPDFYRIEQIEPQALLDAFAEMVTAEKAGAGEKTG